MTIGVNRTVKREACAAVYSGGKRRPVIIEIEPPGNIIGFRLKGTRRTYYLPVEWCFRTAARQHFDREKANKKKEREIARKANR